MSKTQGKLITSFGIPGSGKSSTTAEIGKILNIQTFHEPEENEWSEAVSFTKKHVAEFYEIDERTVDRYIERNKSEFDESGYEVLKHNRLKEFKIAYVNDTNVVNIDESLQKAPSLGVFTFRAFLNIGMLLTESEKAKLLRALMASRDMAFRDALHEKLKNYITHLSTEEFDKFLGEKSMDLEERILNNIDVFKRLKNR